MRGAVSRLLDRGREGEALAAAFAADMAALAAAIAKAEKKPRVLFVLNASRGILAAGQNTAADHMIVLAGGVNAIQGYSGYKPLAAEAVIAGKPDYILATEHGLEQSGGDRELLKRPDIAETPAGRGRRIIGMNAQLLLGFVAYDVASVPSVACGPRLGLRRRTPSERPEQLPASAQDPSGVAAAGTLRGDYDLDSAAEADRPSANKR